MYLSVGEKNLVWPFLKFNNEKIKANRMYKPKMSLGFEKKLRSGFVFNMYIIFLPQLAPIFRGRHGGHGE